MVKKIQKEEVRKNLLVVMKITFGRQRVKASFMFAKRNSAPIMLFLPTLICMNTI